MIAISGFRLPSIAVLLFALAAVTTSMSAQAQEMTLAPSNALSCLVRKDGKEDKLEYPKIALDRKDSGTIKVDMTFTAPDLAPRAKLDTHVTGSVLEQAVKDFVDDYRLPCFDTSGGPVTLHREFLFVPNDGRKVMSSNVSDMGDTGRSAQVSCIKNVAGLDRPEYPKLVANEQAQGKFFVETTFTAPDQPPEVKWLVAARNHALRWAAEQYVKDLRMPCQHGAPVHSRTLMTFSVVDGKRAVMRDLTLPQYIAAAREMPSSVYFDLDKMACPFDLRVRYMQPFGANVVSELDTANPARKPFIDWISNITFKLSDEQLSQVIGDSFTLSVSCGAVDL